MSRGLFYLTKFFSGLSAVNLKPQTCGSGAGGAFQFLLTFFYHRANHYCGGGDGDCAELQNGSRHFKKIHNVHKPYFLVKHKNNLSGGNITKYFVLSSLFLAFFVFFLRGVLFMRKGKGWFGEEKGRGGDWRWRRGVWGWCRDGEGRKGTKEADRCRGGRGEKARRRRTGVGAGGAKGHEGGE